MFGPRFKLSVLTDFQVHFFGRGWYDQVFLSGIH